MGDWVLLLSCWLAFHLQVGKDEWMIGDFLNLSTGFLFLFVPTL